MEHYLTSYYWWHFCLIHHWCTAVTRRRLQYQICHKTGRLSHPITARWHPYASQYILELLHIPYTLQCLDSLLQYITSQRLRTDSTHWLCGYTTHYYANTLPQRLTTHWYFTVLASHHNTCTKNTLQHSETQLKYNIAVLEN